MNKIICGIALLTLLVHICCSKYKELEELQEAQDTCRITGRLFLYDTLIQQGQFTAQAKKRITIIPANQTDTLNYLYSATTDDNGYFQFKYLTRNKPYRVMYEETVNGVLYRADTLITPPVADMRYIVSPSLDRQKGIYYVIVNADNQPVPRASVCIFENQQAYLTGKCENANFNLTTDAFGRLFLTGLQQKSYYIIATATIGNTKYTARDTAIVTDHVMQSRLMIAPPATTAGVQFTITDPAGFVAKGVKVCLFLNPDFAQSGTCDGSLFSDSTDVAGKVMFNGLEHTTYYVNARLTVGTKVYKKNDVLVVSKNEIYPMPLQLELE